ncbi:uncharacterized protein LOC136024620 isoform X2 [Artemia franciscana]|uniref:uncharacterized protein LOC136024620 isoform X2 n=1 Tax=Artemia franciscana TaxID=6661 RepID=UPI0032DBDB69
MNLTSAFWILLFFSLVKAQLDPASLVQIIATSIALVKYVADIWKAISNETIKIEGELGEALPDLTKILENKELQNMTLEWTNLMKYSADRKVLSQFAAMNARLDGMNQKLSSLELSLSRLVRQLPVTVRFEVGLDRILTLIRPIHSLYDNFRLYQQERDQIEKLTLEDFALTIVSHSTTSIRSLLWQLHDSVLPGPFSLEWTSPPNSTSIRGRRKIRKRRFILEGIFHQFKNYLEVYNGELCNLTKSPQQLIYDLYNLLALTDAKGYAMMQFSWMLLKIYEKGDFTRESDLARQEFEKRVTEKAQVARSVISQMSNWYDRCINEKPVENETYIQFTEVLQGYVVNEVDLNTENTCKEECKSYTAAQEFGCHKKTFCNSEKRCDQGKLHGCTFFEADSSVCMSTSPHRRYDWIEYKSGRLIGQKTECRTGNTKRADSWWRFLYHCSNCICLCDQPGPRSDRYVSLRPAVADVLSGNIVTGVRFVKEGRVVHIQIQEGKSLPRGSVNASSMQWRPVEPITPNDDSTALINKYSDYATLTYEERALDLDHLMAPQGHVVIGLRFRRLGGHINLEMQVAPIEFFNGWVDYGSAVWIGNDNTPASEESRKQVQLHNPDTPLRTPSRPLEDAGDNEYVEFQASSIEKDVGQTTIPFLDAQAVIPQPPMWITGIALVHKGNPGYGGYVAFKVATYNMTDHILVPNSKSVSDPEKEINTV